MEIKHISIDGTQTLLLDQFNKREPVAFGEIYSLFYTDFHRYTLHLYKKTTIDSDDIIQDIFLSIWEKRSLKFESLIKLKGFVIIAIKNGYRNYIRHAQYELKYAENAYTEKNFEYDVVEFELYSRINEALDILPKDCAKIIELYIDGYNPEEISTIMGKQLQTIYNKKQIAISTLRRKLSKDKLLLFSIFLNI